MLPQVEMIERVRTLCQQDQRLVAALMYGSFARIEPAHLPGISKR